MMDRTVARVRCNRWDQLTVPRIGQWRPSLRVSVVVPAYNCQQKLDLTLASLSVQTYPSELLEVIVVDDGSQPAIELPKIAPANCQIVRAADHSPDWGCGNARHVGARLSSGEIIQWLDADMVAFPEHIEAQARWHHVVPYAVTLGYKRFVNDGWSTPDEVVEHCRRGTIGQLFPDEQTVSHVYVEDLIRDTNELRSGQHHLNFRAHVGATSSVRRELYLAAGEYDTKLPLGEDTEFGYRLSQAGALFVPEPEARSWHMGPSHMMTPVGEQIRRHNQPFLAQRMPLARWLRHGRGRVWTIPLVTAVVEAGDRPLELVRTCVDRLLASDEDDLRVLLVGEWERNSQERRAVLADAALDRRLIAATYEGDPRVALVTSAPDTVFPSPYRLDVPVHLGVETSTVRRLIEDAEQWQAGLVRVVPAGDRLQTIDLWRTAAVSRARVVQREGERLEKAVADVYGLRWISGVDFGVTDLSEFPAADLRSPRPRRFDEPEPVRQGRVWLQHGRYGKVIPVGGLRSLLRAGVLVAQLVPAFVAAKMRRATAALLRRSK